MASINPPPVATGDTQANRPSWQDSFWPRGGDDDPSLESFAIATTPFHEADEDGEYYMDENGNWLHRWVTETEVRSTKAIKPQGGQDTERTRLISGPKGSNSRSVEERGNPDELGASSSSDSNAEQVRRLSGRSARPKMSRHSQSSFIPSERANHRSPERIDGVVQREPPTPWPQQHDPFEAEHEGLVPLADPLEQQEPRKQTEGTTQLDPRRATVSHGSINENMDSRVRSAQLADKTSDPSPLAGKAPIDVAKALSCPTSPLQYPTIPPTHQSVLATSDLAGLEALPRLDDVQLPEPSENRSTHTKSRRSSRASRSWSTVQMRRAHTEDPYIMHQRAVELFSPPSRSSRDDGHDQSILPIPVSSSQRTMPAAKFLASKADEVSMTSTYSPFSQGGSVAYHHAAGPASTPPLDSLNRRTSYSNSDRGRMPSHRNSLGPIADDARGADTDNPPVPALTDHRITLDWTHPETRARAARKRRGIFGRMKRILSRSRSRTHNDRGEEFIDSGSVRRLVMQNSEKELRAGNLPDQEIDSDQEECKDEKGEGAGRTKGGWRCFR